MNSCCSALRATSRATAYFTTRNTAIRSSSCFFFSSRRRHTRCSRDWSSDVCSSDLREARGEGQIKLKDFRRQAEAAMEMVNIPRDFSSRYLNEGFSGGEKKRMEILQMAMLRPRLAVLDETDSGLDIDALNTVAHGVNTVAEPSGMGVLIITHYQRILHMVKPQFRSDFSSRYLNEGFSGGEKKRMEILQMAMLRPRLAVLDETDSGLDIDALNTVAHGVNTVAEPSGMGVLIITHYQRILHMVKPQF